MYRYLRKKVGQNTAEYAILVGVVIAGVVAMQLYVRRGMQARIKDAVDYSLNIDDAPDVFKTPQYEPYYYSQSMQTEQSQQSYEQSKIGGAVVRGNVESLTNKTGIETYGSWNVTP